MELVNPIQDKLYKAAYVYMKNEDDALDCIHEAIVKAITSLHTLKEPQYFNTWISRIVVNTCKDKIKKDSKVVLVDINDYENNLVTEDEQSHIKEDINSALDKLSEKERDLIVMRYLEDKSLKHISNEKSIPLGTVKSRINRTLIKLKKYMMEV